MLRIIADVLLIHGLDGGQILARNAVDFAAALGDVPLHAAQQADIGIDLHKQLEIQQIADAGIIERMDAFEDHHIAGNDRRERILPAVLGIIIPFFEDGTPFGERFEILIQQIVIIDFRVIVIDARPVLQLQVGMILIIGILMNQGIHGIDIMCGLLGTPTAVSGRVATRYHHIEAEDTAVASLTFPNGMLGSIDSSTAINQYKPRRLEICGSDGLIVAEEDRIVLAEGVELEADAFSEYQGSSDPRNIGLGLHSLIYENILAAMEGKAALEYTPEDAANTVRVICAINRSSETGMTIQL